MLQALILYFVVIPLIVVLLAAPWWGTKPRPVQAWPRKTPEEVRRFIREGR